MDQVLRLSSDDAILPPVGCCLQEFAPLWRKFFPHHWAADVLRDGVQIPFMDGVLPPPQRREHPLFAGTAEQMEVLDAEVASLLRKGATEEVTTEQQGGWVSTLFCVPKPGDRWRPCLNLKPLNQFVAHQAFRMEGLKVVRSLVRRGDWLASVDLTDAYFHVPVAPEHRKFLRFRWGGRLYQFRCLPFGLATAPWLFTKLMKPVIARLRAMGVRCVIYLDDLILMADTRALASEHAKVVTQLFCTLGLRVNVEKSELRPSRVRKFLGFHINTKSMVLQLPPKRLGDLKRQCRRLLVMAEKGRLTTPRQLAGVLGRLNWAADAVMPARLFSSGLLHMMLQGRQRVWRGAWDRAVPWTTTAMRDLRFWTFALAAWNGRSLLLPTPAHEMQTDASHYGWGGVLVSHPSRTKPQARGFFTPEEEMQSNNARELRGIVLSLEAFAHHFRWKDCHVRVWTDNVTAMACVRRQRGASEVLDELTRRLWHFCLRRGLWVTARHIPGKDNDAADALSRWKTDSSDWSLQDRCWRAVESEWGPHSVDLFASALNSKCRRYASWGYDAKATWVDAFSRSWRRENPFVHPPLKLIFRVLNQLRQDRGSASVVLPFWPSAPWFPVMIRMLTARPIVLGRASEVLDPPRAAYYNKEGHSRPPWRWPLIAVRLSGATTRPKAFRRTLARWCSALGATPPTRSITQLGVTGLSSAHAERIQSSLLWSTRLLAL